MTIPLCVARKQPTICSILPDILMAGIPVFEIFEILKPSWSG